MSVIQTIEWAKIWHGYGFFLAEGILALEAENEKLRQEQSLIKLRGSKKDTDCGDYALVPVERITELVSAEAKIEKLKSQVKTIDVLTARIAKLKEALKFTVHAANYLYNPDIPLLPGLAPQFYHTLTYEGDLKLIEKTKMARTILEEKDE